MDPLEDIELMESGILDFAGEGPLHQIESELYILNSEANSLN